MSVDSPSPNGQESNVSLNNSAYRSLNDKQKAVVRGMRGLPEADAGEILEYVDDETDLDISEGYVSTILRTGAYDQKLQKMGFPCARIRRERRCDDPKVRGRKSPYITDSNSSTDDVRLTDSQRLVYRVAQKHPKAPNQVLHLLCKNENSDLTPVPQYFSTLLLDEKYAENRIRTMGGEEAAEEFEQTRAGASRTYAHDVETATVRYFADVGRMNELPTDVVSLDVVKEEAPEFLHLFTDESAKETEGLPEAKEDNESGEDSADTFAVERGNSKYQGPPLDGGYQHISERPYVAEGDDGKISVAAEEIEEVIDRIQLIKRVTNGDPAVIECLSLVRWLVQCFDERKH